MIIHLSPLAQLFYRQGSKVGQGGAEGVQGHQAGGGVALGEGPLRLPSLWNLLSTTSSHIFAS